MKEKDRNSEGYSDPLFIAATILFICVFGILINLTRSPSIWADEAYSLKLIQQNYINLLKITSQDYHPPLYYFILKFIVDLFAFEKTYQVIIPIAKFVSVIPYVFIFILGMTRIRRLFGNVAFMIFMLCVSFMPQMMRYYIEIRMYSWALFFVTSSLVFALSIVKESKKSDWILFLVSSVLAAYTHNFALISIAVLYLVLLVIIIVQKSKDIRSWFVVSLIMALAYLPWFFVILSQLQRLKGDYWILPITFRTILTYFVFAFCPTTDSIISYGLGFMLMAVLALSVLHYYRHNKLAQNKSEPLLIGMSIIVFVGTITIGIVVSVLFKPVFVPRYMIPSIGCFWLGISVLLSRVIRVNKRIFYLGLVMLTLNALATTSILIQNETKYHTNFDKLEKTMQSFHSQASIVADDPEIATTLSYYLDNSVYLTNSALTPQYQKIFTNLHDYDQLDELNRDENSAGLQGNNPTRYSFYTNEKPESIDTDLGAFNLEKYEFKVFSRTTH